MQRQLSAYSLYPISSESRGIASSAHLLKHARLVRDKQAVRLVGVADVGCMTVRLVENGEMVLQPVDLLQADHVGSVVEHSARGGGV